MEIIILILIVSIPSLIQILGYYLSVRFNQPKIRWIVFVVSMLVYYSLVFYIYQSILEKHFKCGNWIFAIIVLVFYGLVMPITQILISFYDKYIRK